MSQFNQSPETIQQPMYTPDKLAEYLRDTNGALTVSLKVLLRGMEVSAHPETNKPWTKVEVKESLDSILKLFEVKPKYYQGAGELEKSKQAQEKVEELKKLFSEIDSSEEVPEGFLSKVQHAVETAMSS